MSMPRTGAEAFKICRKNKSVNCGGMQGGGNKECFELLWSLFRSGEAVTLYCPAVYREGTSHFVKDNWGIALALTSQRLILAWKWGRKEATESLSISTIANVNIKKGAVMPYDVVTIRTPTESMELNVHRTYSRQLYDALQEAIDSGMVPPAPAAQPAPALSTVEEIAKMKELLDAGAITQDEFDLLKRKALGL